jgi:hypothetical protein
MLTVAAARLEQDHGNAKLIEDLRAAAKAHAKNKAEGRLQADEEKRIGKQRTLTAMLPDTRSVDALKAAMLQRAYDLLWDGDWSACDAIIEFLPSADVEKMLNAYDQDQDPKRAEKSQFYAGGTN